jgi:hypothetical protein
MVTGQQQTVSQKILQCFLLHTRSKEKVVNFILQQKNFKGGSKIIFPTPQTTTMLKTFSISTVNFPFKVVIYTVKRVL